MKIKFIFFLMLFLSCNSKNESSNIKDNKSDSIKRNQSDLIFHFVKNEFKHDISSFTEGFSFNKSILFESTGSPDELPETKSMAGYVDLSSGKIISKINLDGYFGEGIAFINNNMYFLTYKDKKCFVYDDITFHLKKTFPITNEEGWGLTTDSKHLIMSDGTNRISYINPINFKTNKVLAVTENGIALNNLNELEYIKGFIYANVYTTNRIVKIKPETGEVVGYLDLSDLSSDSKKNNSKSLEMNGIAYDSLTDKVFVTGKMWPKIYEIQFQK